MILDPSKFIIKSPFNPSFKSFLSYTHDPNIDDEIENYIVGEELDSEIDDKVRKLDAKIDKDKSDNYSWIGNDNPLELYNQAHLGGSLIEDDFFELKKGILEKFSYFINRNGSALLFK